MQTGRPAGPPRPKDARPQGPRFRRPGQRRLNLRERFDVSPAKLEALLERLKRLQIRPELIEERFIRGGGKGGQKINKTANCVQLSYPPMGIAVRAQQDRRRTVNRFLALRELADRIETRVSPETSPRLKEAARLRRRKALRARRARAKYCPDRNTSETSILQTQAEDGAFRPRSRPLRGRQP